MSRVAIFNAIFLPITGFLWLIVALACLFALFVLWYKWDSDKNHGFGFGYYGVFNRVSHAIAALPEISIQDSWHNHDVTLEEFGFTCRVKNQQDISLFIAEQNPIRHLRGRELADALTKRVEAGVHAKSQYLEGKTGQPRLGSEDQRNIRN